VKSPSGLCGSAGAVPCFLFASSFVGVAKSPEIPRLFSFAGGVGWPTTP